ncbi:MAG: hypothetical protein QXO15_03475 [Nitrososphaerota archaeon]
MFDAVESILRISVIGEKSVVYEEPLNMLGQISSYITRITTITFAIMFIAFMILRIFKPEIIYKPVYGVSLVMSLVLISPILIVTYNMFEQPVLHTYVLTILGVVIAFYATCISFIIKLKHNRLLFNTIKAIAIILTILMSISISTSVINSYIVNVNPVLPRDFHKDAQNLANFIAVYVKTQSSIFVVSSNVFIAQLYFRTVFTNTTMSFKYYPLRVGSDDYVCNLQGASCFYALQYPQGIWNNASHTRNIIDKSLGLTYNDGKFMLINLSLMG